MPRRDVAALVVRMAVEHPQWGYTRIRGALSNLGHEIARASGEADPTRPRDRPGSRTEPAHAREDVPAGARGGPHGLAIGSPSRGSRAAGLQRDLVCFVVALQSRRVPIAGIHPQPYGAWMEQMARNLTDPVDGCLRRARSLMPDRDPLDTRVLARS